MKKARKVLVFLMVLTFTLSVSLSAFAASGKSHSSNSNGKGKGHSTVAASIAEEQPAVDTAAVVPWVVKANKNLIQFRSPDEKGGKIVIPIVALRNHLGLLPHDSETVSYNQTDGTITITLGGKILEISSAGISITAKQTAEMTLGDDIAIDAINPEPSSGVFESPVTGSVTFSGGTPLVIEDGIIEGIAANLSNTDPLTHTISGTFSANVNDPVLGLVTLSGQLEGTVNAPIIKLGLDITAKTTSGFADLTSGQAVVPFDQLTEMLGIGPATEEAPVTPETTLEPVVTE